MLYINRCVIATSSAICFPLGSFIGLEHVSLSVSLFSKRSKLLVRFPKAPLETEILLPTVYLLPGRLIQLRLPLKPDGTLHRASCTMDELTVRGECSWGRHEETNNLMELSSAKMNSMNNSLCLGWAEPSVTLTSPEHSPYLECLAPGLVCVPPSIPSH